MIAEAAGGESIAAYADTHIDALRAYRRRPGMFNVFARQRLALFADTYASAEIYPPNTMLDADGEVATPGRSHFLSTQQAAIQGLGSGGRRGAPPDKGEAVPRPYFVPRYSFCWNLSSCT